MMSNPEYTEEYGGICPGNQLCFPLYACAKEAIRQYHRPPEPLNLPHTRYAVMMVLGERGGMTEGGLGRIVHPDSGSLAPPLKPPDKMGCIIRARPDSNERKLYLALTDAGAALKEKAPAVPCARQDCLGLAPNEMKQRKTLLDRAFAGMEENA